VVFDVGETLVDETELWERHADAAGVPRFTLMGVLGGLAVRGEDHRRVWDVLGVERPRPPWRALPFYPDALSCLARLRAGGLLVGAAGNTSTSAEEELRPHVDVVGSAQGWGVGKPSAAFFERVVELTGAAPHEVAYVGDRVDNDVEPALAAGLVAVHLRRGPWGLLHDPPPSAIAIRSLDELPEAFGA
jgi:HAD superfamily hydrolase (TIGR01509 family)